MLERMNMNFWITFPNRKDILHVVEYLTPDHWILTWSISNRYITSINRSKKGSFNMKLVFYVSCGFNFENSIKDGKIKNIQWRNVFYISISNFIFSRSNWSIFEFYVIRKTWRYVLNGVPFILHMNNSYHSTLMTSDEVFGWQKQIFSNLITKVLIRSHSKNNEVPFDLLNNFKELDSE